MKRSPERPGPPPEQPEKESQYKETFDLETGKVIFIDAEGNRVEVPKYRTYRQAGKNEYGATFANDEARVAYLQRSPEAQKKFEDGPHLTEAPHGVYEGRHVIGQASDHVSPRIAGGVFISASRKQVIGEMCVVDDSHITGLTPEERRNLTPQEEELIRTESHNPLDEAYARAVGDIYTSIQDMSETDSPETYDRLILTRVFDTVQSLLTYDKKLADDIAKKYPGQKVALSNYLKHGAGVCRHQALLGAYLLERLADDGVLDGTVSIDASIVKDRGGHAWIRYTDSTDTPWIVDPAIGFVGTLDEAREHADGKEFYPRPSENKQISFLSEHRPSERRPEEPIFQPLKERRYPRPRPVRLEEVQPSIDGRTMRDTTNDTRVRVRLAESKLLRDTVNEMLQSIESQSETPLQSVARIVHQALPRGGRRFAEQIIAREADSRGTVRLESFMEKRSGTDGARAALASALLEQLISRNIIQGSFRIQHAEQPDTSGLFESFWVEYTDEQGEKYVISTDRTNENFVNGDYMSDDEAEYFKLQPPRQAAA